MLTFVGLIQIAIGMVLLLRGSLASMLVFAMISGMFGGSASVIVGGSSIPPVQFALAFIWIRMIIPGSRFGPAVGPAFRENIWLLVFVIYGVAIAYVGPRLFIGDMEVSPLRVSGPTSSLYSTVLLEPSSQNVTAAIYLIGTLMSAVATYVACRYRGGANALVRGAVIVAYVHAFTGRLGAVGRGTPVDAVFEVFRNATYSQLEQEANGFARINGLFPEPSAWASFAFSWFVLLAECWYRSIEPKSTGRAAALLLLVLLASTSSSAYVAVGGYAAFFAVRVFIFPQLASHQRIREASLIGLAAVMLLAVALIALPAFAAAIQDIANDALFEKADSESGRQRLFWALQGLEAFQVSFGLGIGPGSFRSSSLITAILGSCGVIGIVSYGAYLITLFQPRRASSWGVSGSLAARLGGAAGTAAILGQIPALVAAPTPVPSGEFAIVAGAALAFRKLRTKNPAESDQEEDEGPDLVPPPFRGGWRRV